jgi:hypothetical protein
MEREREGVVGIWLGVLVVVRIGWRWIGVIIPRGSCAVLDMPAGHCTDGVCVHYEFVSGLGTCEYDSRACFAHDAVFCLKVQSKMLRDTPRIQ